MPGHLHSELRLFIANDSYTLVGDSEKAESLHIDRISNTISISGQSASRELVRDTR